MQYPIHKKLTIGISSGALFDLRTEDALYQREGRDAYREYQKQNEKVLLPKGGAFSLICRLLNLNTVLRHDVLEVVLLSKNEPEVGKRVFNSIEAYNLPIRRASFTGGGEPFRYIPAYDVSLFLSCNQNDVRSAIAESLPAGLLLDTLIHDETPDGEIRIAFDFDGVLVDDSSEQIYQSSGKCMDTYLQNEIGLKDVPFKPGLLAGFLKGLSEIQKLEREQAKHNPVYRKSIKTYIITARGAPAHNRIYSTLEEWGIAVDELFLLNGSEKKGVLNTLKPHLYFDDQIRHLDTNIQDVTMVHVPYGIANK